VVDRRFIFQSARHGSAEAERFVLLMRRLEAFSDVRVLTYALMSNHFDLLCELLDRIEAGYAPARRQALQQELARLRQEPDSPRSDPKQLGETAPGTPVSKIRRARIFPYLEATVHWNTYSKMSVTPQAIQELLDELESSKQSRLRAWRSIAQRIHKKLRKVKTLPARFKSLESQ